jgi:4-phytase/acid phosphatase
MNRIRLYLLALCLTSGPSFSAPAGDGVGGMHLEQVVLLYRHGVRAPLDGEVQWQPADLQPWPSWPVAASQLTAHGREGVTLMGSYDRQWMAAAGLLATDGCPAAGTVHLWANTDARTIDSAAAWADGFAPGCGLTVGHRAVGSDDPLFHPLEAGVTHLDANAAIAAIRAENGGPEQLTAAAGPAMATFFDVMGCTPSRRASERCRQAGEKGSLQANEKNDGVQLKGPIFSTSGTAEVILMAYAQGMPNDRVGWGRTDARRLAQLSRLHALLFEIYARPTYLAQRVGGPLAEAIRQQLGDPRAPRVSVYVASDNNIVALASLLGAHFRLAGYGLDDPPIGGALALEVWQADHDGPRYVRVVYRAQQLAQLRTLVRLTTKAPPAIEMLAIAGCHTDRPGWCPLDQAKNHLHGP